MNLTEITVSRTVAATPERIFDVWIDSKSPGSLWYGLERVILNPVVDGLFYHAVKFEGRVWPHYGRFIRLDRPRCLEFTWVSEATKGIETVVLVTLEPKGAETEVTLRHSGVVDDEMGRGHKQGWTWLLDMVAERFAKSQSSPPAS
jgi:uncharacterized protein YndB with AHSA1/START domain